MRTTKMRILPLILAAVLMITMFLFAIPATANDFPVGTLDQLKTAITNASSGDTITITAGFNINSVTNIPGGKSITIQSEAAAPLTLTTTAAVRHFIVDGTLTLKDIMLDGNANLTSTAVYGGVSVRSGGTLNIKDGAVIKKCYYGSNTEGGGGVAVLNGGTLNMTGGTIGCAIGNTTDGNRSPRGGGIWGQSTTAKKNIYPAD